MIRVAAVGDLHVGRDSAGTLAPHLELLDERADVLLVAGDLTTCGDPDEARVLASELEGVGLPVLAVLGNHDHHAGRQDELSAVLEDAGIRVLDGEAGTVELDGTRLGVAGIKGFGGGFLGACAADFGEAEMKAFVAVTKEMAGLLRAALSGLDADARVALLHYSPVEATLLGERREIYPFLGSHLLARAVDEAGADLVLHGHAHRGAEHGLTPGGIPVRNVSLPVIRQAYRVFHLEPARAGATRGR